MIAWSLNSFRADMVRFIDSITRICGFASCFSFMLKPSNIDDKW